MKPLINKHKWKSLPRWYAQHGLWVLFADSFQQHENYAMLTSPGQILAAGLRFRFSCLRRLTVNNLLWYCLAILSFSKQDPCTKKRIVEGGKPRVHALLASSHLLKPYLCAAYSSVQSHYSWCDHRFDSFARFKKNSPERGTPFYPNVFPCQARASPPNFPGKRCKWSAHEPSLSWVSSLKSSPLHWRSTTRWPRTHSWYILLSCRWQLHLVEFPTECSLCSVFLEPFENAPCSCWKG